MQKLIDGADLLNGAIIFENSSKKQGSRATETADAGRFQPLLKAFDSSRALLLEVLIWMTLKGQERPKSQGAG